jgi:hypothetical protein
MDRVSIKSCTDSTTLIFSVTRRGVGDKEYPHPVTFFEIEVANDTFTGGVATSTYFAKSPSEFFGDLAKDWKGWSDPKVWGDLEGTVTMNATINSTGNIVLFVELRGGNTLEKSLTTNLHLEAGQLENIANEMGKLFSDNVVKEHVHG